MQSHLFRALVLAGSYGPFRAVDRTEHAGLKVHFQMADQSPRTRYTYILSELHVRRSRHERHFCFVPEALTGVGACGGAGLENADQNAGRQASVRYYRSGGSTLLFRLLQESTRADGLSHAPQLLNEIILRLSCERNITD